MGFGIDQLLFDCQIAVNQVYVLGISRYFQLHIYWRIGVKARWMVGGPSAGLVFCTTPIFHYSDTLIFATFFKKNISPIAVKADGCRPEIISPQPETGMRNRR